MTAAQVGERHDLIGLAAEQAAAPRQPATSTRARRGTAAVGTAVLPWLIPVALVLAWEVASRNAIVDPILVPAPSTVLETLVADAQSGLLWENARASLGRWALGFALGAGSGIFLGALVGLYKVAEVLFDTSVQMVRTVPNLGLIPLFILWMGLGESPKILLVALACFFPLYINTFAGIRNIDSKLVEVGTVYRFGPGKMLLRVVLPAALPQIFTGMRYGLGVAWLALVVSELVGASSGLGYMIQMGQAVSRVDIVMGGLVVFAIVGKLVDVIIKIAENRLLRWRDTYVGV